jgi:GLPGLI family protein
MKRFLFILIITFSLNSYSQSVEDTLKYRVVYELTYQPDSTDVNSKKSETMWLFTGGKGSLFLSERKALKDSLSQSMNISQIGSQDWKDKTAATKTDFDFKIYKNRDLDKIYHTEKIFQDGLYYIEKASEIKWKIEDDTKQIAGYPSQKATTSFAGRNFIAWFTSAIPIPDGPYKFSGLPGLILEVSDVENEYVFHFKGLSTSFDPIVKAFPPKLFGESSKEDFLKLKRQYQENPIKYINNYVGESGKKITISFNNGNDKNKYRKKRKVQLAKENNPIELE